MLAEAADAQLVEPLHEGRYRFRPEIRRLLADAAGPEHGSAECAAAVSRALDCLLNRALHAAHAALPQSWRVETAPATDTPYRDEAAGMAALRAEAANVIRAVSVAQEYGHVDVALRPARTLWPLQLKAGYWDEVLPALQIAGRCLDEHDPGSRTAAALHFQLGPWLGELRRWEEVDRETHLAVAAERGAGHLRGEASSVELQGLQMLSRWRYGAAYERFVEANTCTGRFHPGRTVRGTCPAPSPSLSVTKDVRYAAWKVWRKPAPSWRGRWTSSWKRARHTTRAASSPTSPRHCTTPATRPRRWPGSPGGLPVAWALANPKVDEREVLADMLTTDPDLLATHPGQTVIGDKGYISKNLDAVIADHGLRLLRPSYRNRKPRPGEQLLKPIRQLIEYRVL